MKNTRNTYRNSLSGLTRELTSKEAENLNWQYKCQLKQNPYGVEIRWVKVEEK